MSESAAQEQIRMPKHGEFCWHELGTTNLEECQKFYSEIFGWKIQKSSNTDTGMDYREMSLSNDCSFGGMYEMTKEMFGENMPPSHWINYIAVDDVDASAKKAVELGGTLLRDLIDIPNVGRMAIIKDPTGAVFSLITLNQPGEN
jgi:predicted enzyme related to lactoylglutathione lyase